MSNNAEIHLPLHAEELKKILPQSFPFLMIDRVVEASVEKVVAVKNVTISEHYFKGHFATYPVMPGVLILESMAQTGLVLYWMSFRCEKNLLLTGAKVRFHKSVIPGDTLKLVATPVKILATMGIVHVQAYVDEHCVAETDFDFKCT
jgi:3-hydroxyacyl-[acyl-carrier-protein] dehydratase